MTDFPQSPTVRLEQSLADRIAAAREQLAAERAATEGVVDDRKMQKFEFLLKKLFGETVIQDLNGTLDWKDMPILVFQVGDSQVELKAVPEWTGHVSWQVNGIEIFKQKYAPEPAEAMNQLAVALARATAG